jgi:hypothetical protein
MVQAEPVPPTLVRQRIIAEHRLDVSFALVGIRLWLDPAIGTKYAQSTYCVFNSGELF